MILKNKYIHILLAIIIILTSGHALYTIYPSISYLPSIAAIVLLFCSIASRKNIALYPTLMLISFVIPMFFTAILGGSGTIIFYLVLILNIIFAYEITNIISFQKFVEAYLRLMTGVSVIALIGYLLYNYTDLLSFLPRMFNSNDREYAIGVIFNVLIKNPDRNCGLFWEPGLFATALTFAMVFEILFKQKPISKMRLVLFVVCYITANSSAGFILLFLCIWLLFVRNVSLDREKIVKSVFSIVISIAFIFIMLNLDDIISSTALVNNDYVSKLLSDNIKDSTRYLALGHNLMIFAEHPIFGAGITYVNQNMMHVADTTTVTHMMSVFGLVGIWYAISWFFGVYRIKNINFVAKTVLIVIIMLVLNKEPHLQFTFTWCLLFYLLKQNPRLETHAKKLKENNYDECCNAGQKIIS